MRKIACSLILWFTATAVHAAEGFWLSSQLTHDNHVREALELEPVSEQSRLLFTNINQAIARVGECSGAFISASGLFITSAHCISEYLPKSDAPIVAGRLRDEIPLPGLQLDILLSRDDVTVSINRQLNGMLDLNRAENLQQIKADLIRQCHSKSQHHCEISALHHGLEFYLQQFKVLRDIRLVYLPTQFKNAPNQLWPRYESDFVILRAYANTANDATDYAVTNQPYQSQFVRLSATGAHEKELVISPGFSNLSRRFATADEVQFHFEQLYPLSLLYLQQGTKLLQQLVNPGTDLANRYQASQNTFSQQAERMEALLSHYQQSGLLEQKKSQNDGLIAWINTSPVRQQLYGGVLSRYDTVMSKQQAMLRRDLVLSYLRYAQLPNLAMKLYQHARNSNDETRENLQLLMQQTEFQYDTRIDMEMALHYLGQYAQLPQALRLNALDQYFALSDGFNRDIVRHKLSAMYRGTALTSVDARLHWMQQPAVVFEQSSDPLISFAVAMQDTVAKLVKEREQFATELEYARAELMEVILAYNDAMGEVTYADTNGQLRYSVGRVSGYQPTDAVWFQPFSSLAGLRSQQRKVNPLILSPIEDNTSLAKIPVNFLSNADSCSGYGFAPTFNNKAELVGIMFSGVSENLLADWYYNADTSRSVHVDSRYIIWQLQQNHAGQRLLHELQLQ